MTRIVEEKVISVEGAPERRVMAVNTASKPITITLSIAEQHTLIVALEYIKQNLFYSSGVGGTGIRQDTLDKVISFMTRIQAEIDKANAQ